MSDISKNRYYQHRAEIRQVCDKDGWNVDIATDIVRKMHGWGVTGVDGMDLQEWRKTCREHQLGKGKSLRDLFDA